MTFSSMYVNKEIEELTPYKYLDSLDSVRFRDIDSALINGGQLHAYADFLLALIMGEGIVVPNNQLIDSLAFIDVASQLIQAAQKTGKTHCLRLRACLFGSLEPYEVAAINFGKIGTEERNHEDRFVLSSWPYLDTDYPRRTKWAEALTLHQSIPLERNFVLPDEVPFVKRLNTVLAHFNSSEGRASIRPARSNKQVRIDEISQVASLGRAETEELLSDLNRIQAEILVDAISVLGKVKQHVRDIDIRSNIVNALVLPDSRKLNPYYFEDTRHPQDTHKAVLSIVDSIYNYATGFGVQADLISHTTRASAEDMATPSFYGLAAWTRLTNKSEKQYILSAPNGIIVPSGIQWNKLIQRKSVMEYLTREKFPWDILFEATTDPTWRQSLNFYLRALHEFRTVDGPRTKDAEKRYSDERSRHLDQSRHRIPRTYLDITDNEFRIRAKEFDELEVEISSIEEKGSEDGLNQKEDNSTTAALTGALSGKLGLAPEISTELSSTMGATVSITNEKYIKQSSLIQSMSSIKGKPSLVFRVSELQDFYQEQMSTAAAIKGIITAIKDVIA